MPSKMRKHKHQKEQILQVKNISVSYGKVSVIKNVSFSIEENEFLAIIGKNGSGKTTLIKAILLLLRSKGNILLGKDSIENLNRREVAKRIAYVPQHANELGDITVYDYISFGRFPYSGSRSLSKEDRAVINRTLNLLKIASLRAKFVNELSGGEKQKVAIAAAIAQETSIIILDEPTTFLDIHNQYEILEILHLLHSQGKTIITIIHDMNHAFKYADKTLVLNKGQVFDYGKPEQVINDKTLWNAFDVKPIFKTFHGLKHLVDIDVDLIKKELR